MEYYFLIDKKNNQVASFSEGKIEYNKEKFDLIEITPTKEEKEKLTQGYKIFMNDKKLDFREKVTEPIDLQNQINNLKEEINKIKEKI